MDRVGHDIVYDRLLTSFEVDPQMPIANFATPANAITLRGIVSPDVLLGFNKVKPASLYDSDIQSYRAETRLENGAWILRLQIPTGFDYLGTNKGEMSDLLPLLQQGEVAPPPIPSGVRFGGLPRGWITQEAGQAVLSGGAIYFGFNHGSGTADPMVYTGQSWTNTGSPGAGPDDVVPFRSYIGPDGKVVLDASAQQSQTRPSQVQQPLGFSSASATVQSDFVDRATGDTISFLQLNNTPISQVLQGFRLPSPSIFKDPKLGEIQAYTLKIPYKLNMVAWHTGNVTYLLASSRLSAVELQAAAGTIH